MCLQDLDMQLKEAQQMTMESKSTVVRLEKELNRAKERLLLQENEKQHKTGKMTVWAILRNCRKTEERPPPPAAIRPRKFFLYSPFHFHHCYRQDQEPKPLSFWSSPHNTLWREQDASPYSWHPPLFLKKSKTQLQMQEFLPPASFISTDLQCRRASNHLQKVRTLSPIARRTPPPNIFKTWEPKISPQMLEHRFLGDAGRREWGTRCCRGADPRTGWLASPMRQAREKVP